ncbi:MAG: zf-HC2 domain-containing protein [Bryobacteraceae bacterium]
MSDYLDDAVDQAVRQKLEAHVSQCPNCFVIVDTTKRTLQVYKGMEPQTIPEDIHARLMVALEKRIAAKKKEAC